MTAAKGEEVGIVLALAIEAWDGRVVCGHGVTDPKELVPFSSLGGLCSEIVLSKDLR
jgi:hypothetical protein